MAVTRTYSIKDVETAQLLADQIAFENPIPENAGVPIYTKAQWAEEWLKRQLRTILGRARRRVDEEQPTNYEDVTDVS